MPETPLSEDRSLLGKLETSLGSRYVAFIAVVAIALVLLLLLAARAQRPNGPLVFTDIWPLGLNAAMVVYILLIHPFMRRRGHLAMQSLHALVPHSGGGAPHAPASPRGEWGAMLVGALLGVAIAHDMRSVEGWLRLYAEATSALMFALLAAAVYGSLARSKHLAARSRAGLVLNVFDGHLLTPFAQWGQSLALVFIGGISLSLLFQSYESLRSIEGVLIYGSLVILALTLFFMSMWTIHLALVKAQQKELARIRRDLAAAREALSRERSLESAAAAHDAYLPVVVLGMYEKQILEAPTWPFNPAIVGRLFASAVAPLSVYVLKLAFGVGGAF